MEKLTLELPAMYGDHHVVEVRRLLSDIAGVEEIYASSSFQVVELLYDKDKVSPDEIKSRLDEAGYLGELPVPVETEAAGPQANGKSPFFRHTAAHKQTHHVVSFAQQIPYAGRPLWPCPGMGAISHADEEVTHG